MRILIVEDSDTIRRMIEALLTARGHKVEAVSMASRGIDAALARPPDAVLVDLHLQDGADGLSVCGKLRQAEGTRAVPVVVIGAESDEGAGPSALEAGASAFFVKPFSPTALLKEIESLPDRPSAKMKVTGPGG